MGTGLSPARRSRVVGFAVPPEARSPSWGDAVTRLQFRRKVLDLIEAGRSVAQVARDLEISEATIYTWRRQDRTDRGLLPGATSKENADLVAARRRIAQLENELKVTQRAVELLLESADPKSGLRRST